MGLGFICPSAEILLKGVQKVKLTTGDVEKILERQTNLEENLPALNMKTDSLGSFEETVEIRTIAVLSE